MNQYHLLHALLFFLSLFIVSVESKVLICYFGSWSVYRPQPGTFDVEDIDPNLYVSFLYKVEQIVKNFLK